MVRIAISTKSELTLQDLFLALKAKQTDKPITLFLYDLEQKDPNSDAEVIALYELFGINFSQIVYVSKNMRYIQAMALSLLHDKKAFNCFCSDKELEARGAKKQYDNFCLKLPPEEIIDNPKPFCVRLKRADDSFMILTQQKEPTKLFAEVILDMLHATNEVVMFEDKKEEFAKECAILDSLGYKEQITPTFLQRPKDEDVALKELLENGYLPEAIKNYLLDGQKEPLCSYNKKALLSLSNKELSRYVGFVDEDMGALAKLYLNQVCTTKELKALFEPLFKPKEKECDLVEIIQNASFFDKYSDFEAYLLEKTQLQQDKLRKKLAYLLTGISIDADVEKIYDAVKNYLKEIVKC